MKASKYFCWLKNLAKQKLWSQEEITWLFLLEAFIKTGLTFWDSESVIVFDLYEMTRPSSGNFPVLFSQIVPIHFTTQKFIIIGVARQPLTGRKWVWAEGAIKNVKSRFFWQNFCKVRVIKILLNQEGESLNKAANPCHSPRAAAG